MSAPRMALRLRRDLFDRPVPPGDGKQPGDRIGVEAHLHHLGRIAGDDGIGRHVVGHHRLGRRDRADGRSSRPAGSPRLHADPHIIADHRVAAHLALPGLRVETLLPAMAENVERIGRKARHGMVGAVHDEACALGDARRTCPMISRSPMNGIVMQHAFLQEMVRAGRIVIIGEVADLDVLGRRPAASGSRPADASASGALCWDGVPASKSRIAAA